MNPLPFVVDERLAAGTVPIGDLALCRVLLMEDARFPWVVLVPRRVNAVEILDLPAEDRAVLMEEIAATAAALRGAAKFEKLNIGALGNIVSQLHIHVIGRRDGDPAWPGPAWGAGRSLPYTPNERTRLVKSLAAKLGATNP
jgi:diadenosine tetraphosphate (Ap4A) HIT family hydrolase